jgi:cyclohexanone monooxygenase
VADRFDLRRDIALRHPRAERGQFDEAAGRWTVAHRSRRRRAGAPLHHGGGLPVVAAHARVRRVATPSRARSTTPACGRTEGVDFTGQRVGVIGTGSSAIQAIPPIARRRPI